MSVVDPSLPDFVTAVKFESIKIITKLHTSVDIAPLVTDLDVFEHLDKPYVTAVLAFLDANDIVGALNLSGGEKVQIMLKVNLEDAVVITKTFYIDKIMASTKTHESEEFFTFHLIEDIAFISNTLHVNQAYNGTTTKIIENLAIEFLDKKINVSSKDVHTTKVIVPNLTPINAMCWIKNRTTTTDGYPFYLFSTLIDEDLQFYDLETLMNNPIINDDVPYTYFESQMVNDNDKTRRRIILNHRVKNTYDMYRLVDEGLIGSEYRYIDTINNKNNKFNFDINKEVINQMKVDNIISHLEKPLYDRERYDWSEKNLNSRKVTRIGSSNAFGDTKSLSERDKVADYRLNEVSRAMSQLLTTDAMSFAVNGIDFLDGETNTTIGNKLRILFLRNAVDKEDYPYDYKKSGDYMIFACKHSFTPSEYTLTFSGVKLSNGEVT